MVQCLVKQRQLYLLLLSCVVYFEENESSLDFVVKTYAYWNLM
jgi:hypothetical protein